MKQKKVILVVFTIFLCYFLLLTPYIVHTNLNEVDAGVVNDLRIVPIPSLPEDIQDVASFTEECTILLVEDCVTGKKNIVIIERPLHSLYKGDVIEITDKIIEWYVDWHAYQFFDKKFDVLIVGDVEQVGAIESFIEEILYSRLGNSIRFGSLAFSLSQLVFFVAPLVLIFYASFSFRKRFYLWNITAILALYSLEVFIFNMVGGMHNIPIDDMEKYFGYLFVALIPFTFFLLKYEESEEGKMRIRKFYDKITGREG
jgi:hypothetical protein